MLHSKQLDPEVAQAQQALFAVALALDELVVNGVQYGVLQQEVFGGFLQKTSGNLLAQLRALEESAAHISAVDKDRNLAALRSKVGELIEQVSALRSFKTLPPSDVQALTDRLLHVRAECVKQIEELEETLQTANRFYVTRPAHSVNSVNTLMANLNSLCAQQRNL